MNGKGFLIVVEGPDGVGRTSVLRDLRLGLEADGLAPALVRLRGSAGLRAPLRDLQRRSDISERALFLLYVADLAAVYREEIAPALAAGRVVLSDRYTLTPVVRAESRGMERSWAAEVLSFLPPPDLTLLLEAPARLRVQRMLARRRFLTPRESGAGATYRRDPQAMLIRYQRQLDALFHDRAQADGVVALDATRDPAALAGEALALVRALRATPVAVQAP